MGKIVSKSFKKADDPFFRTSFKVFSPAKFGQKTPVVTSQSNKNTSSLQRSVSLNSLKPDT